MIDQIPTILGLTIAVFLVMSIGGTARHLGWLTREADEGMLKLCIRVLVPCLIFRSVVGNPAFDNATNIFMPPLFGFLSVAAGTLIAAWIGRVTGRFTGMLDAKTYSSFGVCVGIFNYGFVPLPLVENLFGKDALGVLFLHNVGVELAIWTICVGLVAGGLSKGWWKHVANPPSITIVVALAVNFLGLGPYIPEMILQVMKTLSTAAIPMMMLLIGANFFDQITGGDATNGKSESFWGTAGLAVLLRCGIFPVFYLMAAAMLPISRELKQVAAIEAAMPAAVFPIVLTRLYGGEPRIALRVTIATTVVGLVTIPLWISSAIGVLELQDSLIHVSVESDASPADAEPPKAADPKSSPTTTAAPVNEAATLDPEVVEVDAQTIAGLKVSTNNLNETNSLTGKIRQLYNRYFSEKIGDLLPNPSPRYAVYHNYQKQSDGDYALLVGGAVEEPPSDKLETTTIAPGKYLKFQAKGKQPEAVIKAWRQIAAYFPQSPHRRAYTTDFERYDDQSPETVEIFVSIE
ncbi:AEC family transporter [Blastopirellula sp. JC732]|uniref:AEC family transporter n=1 Tax=Blastopirellula sediminis TaxID=2894196 RepID=A0A9X1MN10_9BACT|nr:AEC family transporter [Blastopirellula sediminis]MCC9606924.1 AEC family transporter [Blastopirellula sediminis]MCC9629781.1 AEC family transporter [Blastopirellula sediminis]